MITNADRMVSRMEHGMSYDKALDKMYQGYREFDLERDLIPQINPGDLMAVSGGQRKQLNKYEVSFPAGQGYHVRVKLGFMDTWEVERVFEREGKVYLKDTWSDVYAWDVSRAVYEASCFHHSKAELQSR